MPTCNAIYRHMLQTAPSQPQPLTAHQFALELCKHILSRLLQSFAADVQTTLISR